MSLLDLFTSGEHKKAKTYFAALVKIAFADGSLDPHELKFLEKMAIRLGIEDAEFTKILEYPERYPIDPPVDYNDRVEQLYYFTRMVFIDDEIRVDEAKVVRKMTVALGFPVKNAEKITDEAIHLVMNHNNLEEFTKAIKVVNSQDIMD
jgi:uncharacterized tellurite resistance protein B-like protein